MGVSTFPTQTSKRLPEWNRVLSAHANVLLEGRHENTDEAILRLLPHLRQPILYRKPGEALAFVSGGSVILRDVDRLCKSDQTRLHEWLDHKPDSIQTVATTESPLFSLVQDGQFERDLYYHLYVILLRLDGASESLD
jgi:hypothetical protein